MGLSGRKTKQRIPDDPRNLCWADDAARFGSNYLAKFGWDGSTGLGVAGEGRTSHIKVSHKLDLLGIGAAQQKDPDGIAWKQNKDFESLLQRLNDVSAVEMEKEITEKKRKYREDGESKTERKKKRKAGIKIDNEGQSATIPTEKIEKAMRNPPRHRAHRARAINAKNISSKSAAHISEILGIAPILSHSSSAIDSTELSGKLTSLTDQVETEKITTSTKSVADYFKEKLNTRSSSATVSTFITSDEACDTPRTGLGSRARLDIFTVTGEVEDQETQRLGSSKISAPSSSLASEKRPKDLDLDDPATTSKVVANSNTQIERQKKKRKMKDEEIESEDKDETKEREERKRKRKLDKEKKVHVEPQDFDNDSKELKRQEKRERKAKKLQESVISHTDTVDETYVKKPQKERKERTSNISLYVK